MKLDWILVLVDLDDTCYILYKLKCIANRKRTKMLRVTPSNDQTEPPPPHTTMYVKYNCFMVPSNSRIDHGKCSLMWNRLCGVVKFPE
jgi:hypothetical protein